MSNDLKVRIRNLIEFVDEYANEEELTTPNGVRATIDIIEELLNKNEIAIDILKPLCEVYETPKRHDMFLKVKGVVVYQFQYREQFILFKKWLETT